MSQATALTFALAVPFLCLALLLWLARLEETLTDGIDTPRPPEVRPAPGAGQADVRRAA